MAALHRAIALEEVHQVANIATHGFYNPTQYAESRYASASLHRSGLVMAGANNHKKPLPDMDDGILTAYEISNLNLSNTKLVVLSGCQTGLGDIQGREGVFGLTRGFKLAGVDYIIASLWSVDDGETAKFMQMFYNLLNTKYRTIPEAFDDTRKQMRSQGVQSWGAWVLVR